MIPRTEETWTRSWTKEYVRMKHNPWPPRAKRDRVKTALERVEAVAIAAALERLRTEAFNLAQSLPPPSDPDTLQALQAGAWKLTIRLPADRVRWAVSSSFRDGRLAAAKARREGGDER